jgi:hypothetical protein
MSNQEGSNLNFKNIQTFQTCLNEKVIKRLKKSIVFADNQFMEWFSLTIGVDYLIKSGVLNIKEFSSFQVIIISFCLQIWTKIFNFLKIFLSANLLLSCIYLHFKIRMEKII